MTRATPQHSLLNRPGNLLVAVAFLALARSIPAATFNVNSTADLADATPGNNTCAATGGLCTLRAAVQEANALAGDDVINLPSGTYNLTITGAGENAAATGDLDITQSVTIIGAGAATTIIDATALGDRVFDISALITSISGVTVRNATAAGDGGGINNTGQLTLTSCVVSGNQALGSGSEGGGINSTGSLTLDRSSVLNNSARGDGGGIRSTSHLTLTGCTIAGNRTTAGASDGGGLVLSGASERLVSGSTFSGNQAGRHGGGILVAGGSLTLINSTLSGNKADNDGGGLRVSGGTLSLRYVTIANNTADAENDGTGNGGGIRRFSGTVDVLNSVIAGNMDPGGEGPDCAGALSLVQSSIIQNAGAACEIENGSATRGNPVLGPLQDNGGPTPTHALLPGSPALGGATTCTTGITNDQRGIARPQYGRCDLGAFELEEIPGATFVVNSLSDEADATLSDGLCATAGGECTLSAAFEQANYVPNADTIIVPAGTYSLTRRALAARLDVTLTGAGATSTIIQWDPSVTAEARDRIFYIGSGSITEISQVTIRNGGRPTTTGGGIFNEGTLTLNDVVLRENQGAAIVNWEILNVTNAVIRDNVGGGLRNDEPGFFNFPAVAVLDNVTISGNSGADAGGGIFSTGRLTVTNATISANSSNRGGGIFAVGQITTLKNVTITNNSATSGSGIWGGGSLENSIVANNLLAQDCIAPVTSLGHNLDGSSSCGLDGAGDVSNADPLLGPLQDNGGFGFTHALLPGSPAIDAGGNNCPPPHTDQRGVPRIAPCDIGAYEIAAGATPAPTFTRSPLQSAPPTASPTATSTPVATDTPNPAATASTPLPATHTPATALTPTATFAATTIASASPTSTATVTPDALGDANCDLVVGAADLPALVAALASTEPGPCGGDADADGDVDEDDVAKTIELVFAQ